MQTRTISTLFVLATSTAALAQTPQMGGPMKHIMVGMDGAQVMAMNPHAEAMELVDYGETYPGAAAVLDGTAYNAQYGWMAMAGLELPAGASLWIELLDATDGLMVYKGGTFEPLHGTDGSTMAFQWDGRMLHNWWAATEVGSYQAGMLVYLGDASGEPIAGYEPGRVTLRWTYRPECTADFNGDGAADIFDFLAYQNAFDAGDTIADLDGDGALTIFDFLAFQNAFDAGC
ncbi:MAG: GC-type dockerin domain-anchored protein [Phycisphaerales bacterium JB064]